MLRQSHWWKPERMFVNGVRNSYHECLVLCVRVFVLCQCCLLERYKGLFWFSVQHLEQELTRCSVKKWVHKWIFWAFYYVVGTMLNILLSHLTLKLSETAIVMHLGNRLQKLNNVPKFTYFCCRDFFFTLAFYFFGLFSF